MKRKTIQESTRFCGIGLHSGKDVQMIIQPAPENSGIVFVKNNIEVPFQFQNIVNTKFCTVLGVGGSTISTTEHFMSVVYALGVTDLRIIVYGPELPILDGSGLDFYNEIMRIGLKEYETEQIPIRIRETLRVGNDQSYIIIEPWHEAEITFRIDFDHPLILNQNIQLKFDKCSYLNNLVHARTFGFMSDFEKLKAAGLAKGATLENTIALSPTEVLNPSGLRDPYEFVAHKALDLVGDFALLGAPFIGRVFACRSGHSLNLEMIKKILNRC